MTDTSSPGGNGVPLQEPPSWNFDFDPVTGAARATFPGLANVTGLNSDGIGGLRNRVINGNFAINQRGYVSGTAIAAAAWGHDRWKAGAGGATYTFVQQTPDTQINITAGTLTHVIEGASFEGGTFTLSWSGTAQGRVYQGAPSGAYAASPITITGLAGGVNTILDFNTGTLGLIQFEKGSIATSFERRPVGLEFSLCQRYYQRYLASFGVFLQGYQAAGQQIYENFAVPPMRAVPTASIIGTFTLVNCASISVSAAGGVSNAFISLFATATALGLVSATAPNNGGFDLNAEL